MKCADARERFAELLEDEPAAGAAVQSHLAGCPACAAEFGLLQGALGELATLQVVPAPDGFADSVMAQVGAAAAPGLAAKLLSSWKSAALGLAGAAALATGLMLPSSSEPPSAGERPAALRQAAGRQPAAEPTAEPRFPDAVGGTGTERVTAETATPAAITEATPEPISGSVAGAVPITGAAAAIAAVTTPAPAAVTPVRPGPGLGGPHTEPLEHPRDGRPVEPAGANTSLDRPLAGEND